MGNRPSIVSEVDESAYGSTGRKGLTPKFHTLLMDDFFHEKFQSHTAVTPVKIFGQGDILKVKAGRLDLTAEVKRLQKSLGDDLVMIPYCPELAEKAQQMKLQSQRKDVP